MGAEAVKVPRKTDQWVQPASAVRLVALWICARTSADMQDGSAVSRGWNPIKEANPRDTQWQRRFRSGSEYHAALAPSVARCWRTVKSPSKRRRALLQKCGKFARRFKLKSTSTDMSIENKATPYSKWSHSIYVFPRCYVYRIEKKK